MGTLERSHLVRAWGRASHYVPPPTSPGDSQRPDHSLGDHPQVSSGRPPDLLGAPPRCPWGSPQICSGLPQISPGFPHICSGLPPDLLRAPPRSAWGSPEMYLGLPLDLLGFPPDLLGAPPDLLGAPPDLPRPPIYSHGSPISPQTSPQISLQLFLPDLPRAPPRSPQESLPRSPPARSHLIPQARLGSLTPAPARLLPSLAPASSMKTASFLSSGPSHLLVTRLETASPPAHHLLQVPLCPDVTTRAGPDLV